MPVLVWDDVGSRIYETGVDRGVLYLADGSAVPWNGLTGVVESFERESFPVYYDGMKINHLVSPGDFMATLKAVTYPDEFIELEGMAMVRHGMYVADQMPQMFNLSYRTKIGNDVDQDEHGYKIHIIYNVMALPKDKSYATQSVSPSLSEFEWDISAIPEVLPGFRPTAHFVIDSRNFDDGLLAAVEKKLYGDETSLADLPPMLELFEFIKDWYRWRVYNHGNGTYTLVSGGGKILEITGDPEEFTAHKIHVEFYDDGSFKIFDTYDAKDIPQIKIIDNGDGTWTAMAAQGGLLNVDEETGYFVIHNANAVMLGPDEYQLSDTTED